MRTARRGDLQMLILVFDTNDDCDKFTALYEKYRQTVMYTISLFIKDEYLKEDLFQDIFIIVGKNLDKIDLSDDKKSRNYIITIARNYCLSHLRKQKKSDEDLVEDITVMESNHVDLLNELIKKEHFQQVIDAVHSLEDKYKMVLELKYINDFSDDEIANFLNIKKKNVQMRLYRAKIMLRNKLGAV